MATNIVQRLRIGLDILRHGLPSERKQAAGAAFPLVWPTFRQGVPQWQIIDLASYISEGFNLNTLIYSAIMYKVRALRSAPLRAYTGDMDQPDRLPADNPLAQLVARPNRQMSWMTFSGQNTVYLNVAGNVYIWMIRARGTGLPEQMYSLRPDRVYIIPAPDKKTIVGYLYVPEGATAWGEWSRDQRIAALNSGAAVPILPQDMAHIKLPNPGDPLDGMGYGLSPFSPLAQSADVDNGVTKFLKNFFDHGAMITGLLKFSVPMQPGDVAQARERWKEIYGGVDNWDIAVLDQGGEYQRVGMTFDEMGFEVLDDRNESRILGPLGVPGILIGTRLGLNRAINANAKELRVMCWQDTLLPENALFEDELQYFLQGEGGEFVAFDYSKVEALKKDLAPLVDSYSKLWNTGVPANLAARTVGLQIEEIPGGDVGYLPLNVVPVASGSAKPTVTQQGAPEAEEQAQQGKALPIPTKSVGITKALGRALTPEAKSALWTKADRIATSWEGKFGDATAKQLEHDKREIMALLSDAKRKSLERKATVDWQDYLLGVKDYLNAAGAESWRETFVPLAQGIITAQGESLNADFGMEFDVRNLYAEQWFDDYMLKFAQPINATTSDDISRLAQKATEDGWSIPQMQKALGALFGQYIQGGGLTDEERQWFEDRTPAYRRENIARTETMRASNAGSNALFRAWGAQRKEWLATNDGRTRPEHRNSNGQVVEMNEKFSVGGEQLEYPGDPEGNPGNTCQCRCTVLPVME